MAETLTTNEGLPEDPLAPEDPQELERKLNRIQHIIRIVSGKSKIAVSTTMPDSLRDEAGSLGVSDTDWFRYQQWNRENGIQLKEFVYIPPTDLKDMEEALGKAAHEASHVRITRMEHLPESFKEEAGFSTLMYAVEERSTDQVVREHFSGAGEWLDKARTNLQGAFANMQSKPIYAQVYNLIIFAPQLSSDLISEHYSSEAIHLYAQIKSDVEIVENMIPSKKCTEELTIEMAKQRQAYVYKEIWPVVKPVIEQYLLQRQMEQLVQAKQLHETLPGLKKTLQDAAKEPVEEGLAPVSVEDEEHDLEPVPNPVTDEEHEPQPGSVPENIEPGIEGPTPMSESAEEDEEEPSAVSTSADDALPPDVSKALADPTVQDAIAAEMEHLSETEREELLKKTEEELRAIEEKIIADLRGLLLDVLQADPDTEPSSAPSVDDSSLEPKRLPMEVLAARHRNETPYQQTAKQMLEATNRLYAKLLPRYAPKAEPKVIHKSAGLQPDLRLAFQRTAGRAAGSARVNNAIFMSKVEADELHDAHLFFVDLSGSMSRDQKIVHAFAGVVSMIEAISRFHVPFEVLGFQDEVIVFKKANEPMSTAVRERISGMVLEVANENPGGLNHANYNDDGPCLLEASDRLRAMPATRRFLHVFSDGQPHGRYSNESDLRRAVDSIHTDGTQALIGYGIGPGTGHVSDYYPTALPNIPIEELPDRAGDVLIDIVEHPENYSLRSHR